MAGPAGGEAAGDGAVAPALYARMLPFLRESVIVVDARWQLVANLSAPDGLLGWGDPTGTHLLAYVHPDDVLRFADTGTGLRETDPGWVGSTTIRLRRSDETYGHYEITMHNCTDDPVLAGMVICTREVAAPMPVAPEFEARNVVASLADQLPTGVVLVSGSGLALYVNDEVLAPDHGFPVRLIGPNRPGVHQTKWVGRIEVLG